MRNEELMNQRLDVCKIDKNNLREIITSLISIQLKRERIFHISTLI